MAITTLNPRLLFRSLIVEYTESSVMRKLSLSLVAPAAIVAALLHSAHAVAGADVYRWTDPNGRVHYGDVPPVSSKPLDVPVPGASKAAKGEKKKETDASACQQARDNLSTYAAASQIKQVDPVSGLLREVTKDERQKMIDAEAAKVSQTCNPPKAAAPNS
jgi:hypothetical protein